MINKSLFHLVLITSCFPIHIEQINKSIKTVLSQQSSCFKLQTKKTFVFWAGNINLIMNQLEYLETVIQSQMQFWYNLLFNLYNLCHIFSQGAVQCPQMTIFLCFHRKYKGYIKHHRHCSWFLGYQTSQPAPEQCSEYHNTFFSSLNHFFKSFFRCLRFFRLECLNLLSLLCNSSLWDRAANFSLHLSFSSKIQCFAPPGQWHLAPTSPGI